MSAFCYFFCSLLKHNNILFSLTLNLNVLFAVCSKNLYLWVVSQKKSLALWGGFGNKLSGLADSQQIIYSEKQLLLVSRLQSPQACFSLRIIHGFSQWQIVGLQKWVVHNFSPKESSVTQGSGNVTIHKTRNTTLCCTWYADTTQYTVI